MDTVTQHQVDLLIIEDEVTFNVVSSTVETVVQQGDHSTIVIANNGIGNILFPLRADLPLQYLSLQVY